MDELTGAVIIIGIMGLSLVILFTGWPRFFTINIHRHYHGKDEGGE